MSKEPKDIVFNQGIEILRKRLNHVTSRLKTQAKLDKVVRKYPMEKPMSEFAKKATAALDALSRLEKKSFVPAQEVTAPMDPAMMGMPMDPSMGGAVPMDPSMMAPPGPAGAMPVDPSMMAPAAAPAVDPSMVDPAALAAAGVDPSMMAPPAAPAPAAEPDPSGPASMADISVLEERMAGYESLLKDMINAIDALGGKVSAEQVPEKVPDGNAPEADTMGVPADAVAMPGPYGGNAGKALGAIRSNPTDNPDKLLALLGKLNEVRAG